MIKKAFIFATGLSIGFLVGVNFDYLMNDFNKE